MNWLKRLFHRQAPARRNRASVPPQAWRPPKPTPTPEKIEERRIRKALNSRLHDFSLDLPIKATSFHIIHVDSFTSDNTYIVNIHDQTCTCPDFRKQCRAAAPKNSLSRWCKHLMSETGKELDLDALHKWHRAIICDGFGGPDFAFEFHLETAPDILLTLRKDSEWMNIYAHTKRKGERIRDASGPIQRYGWQLPYHRWSYGQPPAGAGEFRKLFQYVDGATFR